MAGKEALAVDDDIDMCAAAGTKGAVSDARYFQRKKCDEQAGAPRFFRYVPTTRCNRTTIELGMSAYLFTTGK